MKDKTKIVLGVVAGAAAGLAVAVALTDNAVSNGIKEGLSGSGEKLSMYLQDLIDDGRDLLGELKDKMDAIPGDVKSSEG